MSKNTVGTASQEHFSRAVHADIQRSVIMRNNSHKTTFNAGEIVPIHIDEVLPGDTFQMDMSFVARTATPLFPTMDNLIIDFYAFFVPNRIVWDGWEELNGENKTSAWVPSTPPALVPVFTEGFSGQVGSIGTYYGLPLGTSPADVKGVNALPFRGYNLIWNEWFRDQNLQAPRPTRTDNTESWSSWYYPSKPLYKANKKHDYFTSCLPAPQKGESALIPIELNELIPVIAGAPTGIASGHGLRYGFSHSTNPLNNSDFPNGSITLGPLNASGTQMMGSYSSTTPANTGHLAPANLWADATGMRINATTISELRTAFQIQKLFERDARGGTRYVEMLKAHFGVDAQDYRLQRPEFLGHMSSYVGMQQVPQTSSTDSTSPQGNVAAFSHTQGSGVLFEKSFVEHGFVHIFAVARHPKTYQQGLEKFWSRRERLDYYMPVLAHISEQPVYNKEIYVKAHDSAANDEIFGYNEAWADYRYKPNRISGQFLTMAPNKLDAWHYADFYHDTPTLSADWIEDNSQLNLDRTLAMNSFQHHQIMIDIYFRNKATRPMPVHSIPGFVDHF